MSQTAEDVATASADCLFTALPVLMELDDGERYLRLRGFILGALAVYRDCTGRLAASEPSLN